MQNNKSMESLFCEWKEYVTQFFCHCEKWKLNGNHMFLEIVASRLIKRFTDQTKFWDNMIKLSFENTPAHLDPYSIQFAFRHYAYSSRISTPLNLGSDTTPTHLESLLQSIFFFQNYTYSFRFSTPLHSICVPKLHLLI